MTTTGIAPAPAGAASPPPPISSRVRRAPRRVATPATMTSELSVLSTWLRLLTCTNLVQARVRAELRERFATTLPRFDVLAQLDAAAKHSPQGLRMSELSRRLMVTNGNVTGLIERLAQERLVTRSVSTSDRRSQLVRLTPAGKRALDAMLPDHLRWITEMFGGLDDTELTQLHSILGKLKSSAQQSPRRRPDP